MRSSSSGSSLRRLLVSVACLSGLLVVACGNGDDDPVLGGECDPIAIPGTYTVTSISSSTGDDQTCGASPQRVLLSFTPDSGASDAGDSQTGQLTVTTSGQVDPPASCLTTLGIVVGSTVKGTRTVNTAGSCAPYYDTFTLDFSSCGCP